MKRGRGERESPILDQSSQADETEGRETDEWLKGGEEERAVSEEWGEMGEEG